MANCSNCGAQTPDGTPNCPSCGAVMDVVVDLDSQNNKGMAILAYIIFLIPLLAAKNSPFARYHTNQGLILFLVSVASGIISLVPGIGAIVAPLINLGVFVLAILGIVNAAKGLRKPLPLIGGFTLLK